MSSIVFERPEYLWVVPIALALVVAWRVFRRRPFIAFPLARLLAPRIYRASRLRHAPVLVAAAALPLIALALTDPVLPYTEGEVKSRGLDIALVLDLSSSMQETMDVVSDTRLEVTKKALLEFIGMRPDDRIGLVVFADYAYVVSPLTFDHEYVRQYVAMIDDQILRGEGMTAIGDGIALGATLLERQSRTRVSGNKVMVVFTDGEHNWGSDPLVTLKDADAAGTRVHMVGIDLDESVKTRPQVLKLISAVRQYRGQYFHADTVGQTRAASLAIDALEKGWLTQTRYIRNRPVYRYFVIPAILILTGALLLRSFPYFVDVT